MKLQESIIITAFIAVMFVSGSSVVLAQDDAEMNDQQYCEQQAGEAGIEDSAEIQQFVSQCLAEINQQSDDNSDPETRPDEDTMDR